MAVLIQTPTIDPTLLFDMLPQQPYPMPADTATSYMSKPHNACDECRTRKLKCSGEPTGCSRCKADRVACRYSPRKQMGRPRKKRKDEEVYPQSSYEPWTIGDATRSLPASMPSEDSSLAFADMSTHLPHSGSYSSVSSGGMGSPALNYGLSNMDLGYLDPSNSQTALTPGLPPSMDMNMDFSNLNYPSTSNMTHEPYSYGSGANYSLTASPVPQALPTPPTATTPAPPEQRCNCLPQLYKTLQALPNYTSNPTFPLTLRPLKHATGVARTLLHCPSCASTYSNALQNSMGSVTLLNLIITTYHKLLSHIDSRAKSAPNKIKFRFGEAHPQGEGHTGGLDCPMGVEVDLSGAEWRSLARKAVRREVMGTEDEEDDESERYRGSVMRVLEGLRARQKDWHSSRRWMRDTQHQQQHEAHEHHGNSGRDSCMCVQSMYFEQLIRQVQALGL